MLSLKKRKDILKYNGLGHGYQMALRTYARIIFLRGCCENLSEQIAWKISAIWNIFFATSVRKYILLAIYWLFLTLCPIDWNNWISNLTSFHTWYGMLFALWRTKETHRGKDLTKYYWLHLREEDIIFYQCNWQRGRYVYNLSAWNFAFTTIFFSK